MFGLLMPKGVFRYSIMPEISTRIHGLFMGGFNYIPFFIAVLYQVVGLLPKNHPYLRPSNLGLYGIRHVVSEAANNITFSLKNIDQILIFLAVLVGLVIFLVQLLSLGAMIFFSPAMAMPTSWDGFFVVPAAYRPHDLSFMMLDMVFGVPFPGGGVMGFFESCIGSVVVCQDNFGNIQDIDLSTTTVDPALTDQFGPLATGAFTYFPFPYHLGMHRLFAIYSNGLLVIAVFIASYFIATILAETAQSGTPFGKRFNKTWAPLRIVVAFGLLMPLTTGLNSSQYIVLYAAKYGSAFATNGWRMFNDTLTTSYLGDPTNLVTVPNTPELGYLTEFLYTAKVCKVVYEHYAEKKKGSALTVDEQVHMYALWKGHSEATNTFRIDASGDSYANLVAGLDPGLDNVTFRFGVEDPVKYTQDRNGVSPICGEINLTLTDPRPVADAEPGPYYIQSTYYQIIQAVWLVDGLAGIGGEGDFSAVETAAQNHRHVEAARRLTKGMVEDPAHTIRLDSGYVDNLNAAVHDFLAVNIEFVIVPQQGNSARLQDTVADLPILYSKGWAGAGIWYNRVAEMNGTLMSSTYSVPLVNKYPAIMEKVADIKAKYDKEVDEGKEYSPTAVGIDGISQLLDAAEGYEFAKTLNQAKFEWSSGGVIKEKLTGNPFLDAISSLLGLDGLYDLRRNPDAHPLAMLVGIGRSLVESAIRSLGYATMASVFAAVGGGAIGGVGAHFFVSIAMMGLTVGFILFYVVPFLPFIYFFFAVGGWIKGIFEAMVGAPLWALAHIRIDGEGISGSAAMNGYFLIFEVFLRPILTVFGLLASISIFSALVDVLNSIFDMVVNNIGGYDMAKELSVPAAESTSRFLRSRIDEFFFTVIYAILVYMIGMSSFKLIDTIPNNILRWMGQTVATFGDQREDPAQALVSKATVGSQQALSKIGGGLHKVVGGAQKLGE